MSASAKRKRSDLNLRVDSPNNIDLSSPQGPRAFSFNHVGRTRKRHRDGRPDEAEVHADTIRKLFEAQRRKHDSPPPPTRAPTPGDPHTDSEMHTDTDMTSGADPGADSGAGSLTLMWGAASDAGPPRQSSTLHTFWNTHAPRGSQENRRALETE